MRPTMRVIQGSLEARAPSAIEAAFQDFRLDRQGNLVSPATLTHYDWMARSFFGWLDSAHPEIPRVEQLDAQAVREYRVELTTSPAATSGRWRTGSGRRSCP